MTAQIGSNGSYVDINGVKTWHETFGFGPHLVLLHGGLSSSIEWGSHVEPLGEHFTLHLYDRRGHGRTGDAGPLSYDLMAQDAIAFLESVVGAPAHLVGWSDGGNIALIVAARRPDLVAKIVPIGANLDPTGVPEPIREMFATIPADSPEFEMLRTSHQAQSPDGPDQWPVFFAKFQKLVEETVLEESELAKITAPTLIMAGDDDMTTLEHSGLMFNGIANAQLAIVPGTSHFVAQEKPELVNGLIRDFLLNDPAPTMMPIRRAQA